MQISQKSRRLIDRLMGPINVPFVNWDANEISCSFARTAVGECLDRVAFEYPAEGDDLLVFCALEIMMAASDFVAGLRVSKLP